MRKQPNSTRKKNRNPASEPPLRIYKSITVSMEEAEALELRKKRRSDKEVKAKLARNKAEDENPFAKDWIFDVRMSNDTYFLPEGGLKAKKVYSAKDKDVQAIESLEFNPYLVDGKCWRIYTQRLAGIRKQVYGMKRSEYQLFFYILFNMEPMTTKVSLDQKTIQTHIGIKRATYFNAIAGLKRMRFIAPVEGGSSKYWINAQFFFQGNRANYFPSRTIDENGNDINQMRQIFKEDNLDRMKIAVRKRKL